MDRLILYFVIQKSLKRLPCVAKPQTQYTPPKSICRYWFEEFVPGIQLPRGSFNRPYLGKKMPNNVDVAEKLESGIPPPYIAPSERALAHAEA